MDLKKIKNYALEQITIGIAFAFAIPAVILGFWAFLILLAQLIFWYSKGLWLSLPALALFYHDEPYPKAIESLLPSQDLSSSFTSWLLNPESALGPHKIVLAVLEYLNLPVFIFLIMIIYLWILFWLLMEFEK
jgi:hypothetical protein